MGKILTWPNLLTDNLTTAVRTDKCFHLNHLGTGGALLRAWRCRDSARRLHRTSPSLALPHEYERAIGGMQHAAPGEHLGTTYPGSWVRIPEV